jgi:hypothetical protein
MYAKPRANEAMPETRESSWNPDETITSHPAFAMIGASRVSGHTNLFGSDFHHNNYMVVRIKGAEFHRSLNRDWHMGRESYIEVAMTESQWATFVSAPNIGDGTPCTLTQHGGKRIPGIPSLERSKLVKMEVDEDLAETVRFLDEALAAVDGLGLSKKKADEVSSKIRSARKRLDDHIPFAAKQFGEYVEDTIEKGKQEIHGYMMNVITRAGINTLQGPENSATPLQIKEDKE